MTSLRGFYQCPSCGGFYKVITNYFHIFEIFVAGLVGGGICMVGCLYQDFGVFVSILLSIISVVLVILPIDKGFDNHHAKTEVIDDPEGIVKDS